MKKSNPTILIVEDDENDWLLINSALKKAGFKGPIHRAADGAEAIEYMMGEGEYANREKYAYPSFILTDLKMPCASGFDVLYFLKGNPEWAVIPTVVFSGSADPDDIKKSYMLGASSYHLKPTSSDELMRQLSILYDYWMSCQVPEVDASGRQVITDSTGKLGESYRQIGDTGGSRKSAGIKRMGPKASLRSTTTPAPEGLEIID